MNLVKDRIFSREYYREVFITITILFTITFFVPFSTILNLFLLAWGSLLILRDLFTKRIIFKFKRFIPLIGFMGIYIITIVINRNLNMFENIKVFTLTALQFFVLFAFDDEESQTTVIHSMKKFNSIIITITFLASTISLFIYLFGIKCEFRGNIIGTSNGMLHGIYTGANTAGPLAAISIIVTLINYHFGKEHKLHRFDYINIAIQLIFIYMTNSRATLYCLILFLCVFSLTYFKGIRNKVIGLGSTALVYILSSIIKSIIYWIYRGIDFIIQVIVYGCKWIWFKLGNTADKEFIHKFQSNGGMEMTEAIEKEISMGFLNGRAQLWQCGFKIFKDHPWFGVGSRNIPEIALTYNSYSELPGITGGGMHNVIFQVIVGNGILGFLALAIFIIPVIVQYIKYLIKTKIHSDNSKIVLLCGILVLMLLVNNMAEVNILYAASYMATVFWTYLGFGIFLINKDIRGENNY